MHVLLLLSFAIVAQSVNSTDDWINVDKTDIWKDLATCAQPCVRNVNLNIFVGNTHCQSYGCVCSESTQGQNFLDGLSSVTACVQKACTSEQDRQDGETAFQDLCLVYAANSTRPHTTSTNGTLLITSEGYPNLTDCARYALNGCLDQNGNRTEANCGPVRKWEHWEEYRGVAAQRNCTDSECLCKKDGFDAAFAVAFEAGQRYCGMWLSTKALPNQEYEDMQNVFATYCASEGFIPKDWWLRLTGSPQGSNQTNSSSTHSESGWSRDELIQLGLGAGIGIPGLAVAVFAAVIAWKQYDWARRYSSI